MFTSELARISSSAAEPNKISDCKSSPRESIKTCDARVSHARTSAANPLGTLLSIADVITVHSGGHRP
jgi:hypothetical protein